MNAGLAPRRTSHRGFVSAGAFWLDPCLIGAETTVERILSLWREGCVMHNVAGGVLIVLPSPAVVESRMAPGVVLTCWDGLLVGAPLSEKELARLNPPRGSVLLCREGRIRAYPLTRETILDPAAWLDVDGFVAQTSHPLGDPPSSAPLAQGIEPAPFASHFDPKLTSPPKEKLALLQALEEARTKGGRKESRFSLRDWLQSRFLHSGAARVAGKPSATHTSHIRRRSNVSWLHRWIAPIRRVLGLWLLRSPLAPILGWRQAQYLEKMTTLFNQNKLDQALRYAIPFATLEGMLKAAPSFAPPAPRADLSITVGRSGGANVFVPLNKIHLRSLKDLYRRACERLERAGEIEKAAFVLLELLKEDEEGIALLERHGRFRFAAEVAQARELPPGMVIRLWFLAGEPAEAVRVARITGAFADAVLRLQRTHPEDAKRLRIVWAGVLAEAGNYGAAVDAVWTVPEARALILEWIERALRLHGSIAARLMVKKIALNPECIDELLPRIREVVYDTLPGGMRAKLSLGKAILEHPDNENLRVLSGFVLRELLKDLKYLQYNPGFDSVVRGLKGFTRDRLLVEDLPSKPLTLPAPDSMGCRVLLRDATDVGLHRLYDGVCLPNGRLVVALGEAGVEVLSRRGTVVAHLDCPADRLVVNDSGNHAIAVAGRGEVSRLARIDLEKLRQQYWCDAAISTAADTFDGEVWWASHQDALMAVDALSGRFESIWHVTDLPGPVLALARNASALSLLVDAPDEPQHWTYELPGITLRQRHTLSAAAGAGLHTVMPKGSYGFCAVIPPSSEHERERFVVRIWVPGYTTVRGAWEGPETMWQSGEIDELPFSLGIYDHLCAVTTHTAEGYRILFYRWPGPAAEPAAQIDLVGARFARIRHYAHTFCIVDDCGRFLVMSPEDFRIVREAKL